MNGALVRPGRVRAIAAVFATIAVATAALAVASGAVSRAAAVPSREMTFIDRDSGFALTLQVEPAARDAGAFVFRVPGVGLYEGRAGAAMRALSPTSVVVDFTGPAVIAPRTSFDGTDAPSPARATTVTLHAQVDPAHRTAEATLTDGAGRYHLVVRGVDKGALATTLKTFETAAVAGDFVALYGLMNLDVRASFDASSFAAQGAAQVAKVGGIAALRRLSVGDVQTTDSGASYVLVSYSADVRGPTGALTTTTYDVYFIPELSAWRIWYTAAR